MRVSLVKDFGQSLGHVFAGGDGVHTGNWSTDGSLAGQRGDTTSEPAYFYNWNGGVIASNEINARSSTRFSSGREDSVDSMGLAPALRDSFAPDRTIKIGRWTYFMNGNQILRSRGDATVLTTVKEFGESSEVLAMSRFAATDRFCVLVDVQSDAQLWVSAGTDNGTKFLRSIGKANALPAELLSTGQYVYFAGSSISEGVELWRTNGTVNGTIRACDILPGSTSSQPELLTTLGDRLLLSTNDFGRALWISDGSPSGTIKLADVDVTSGAQPNQFARLGDRVFFFGFDAEHGIELWVTDGTPAGTQMFRNIAPTKDQFSDQSMVAVKGRVYFDANPGAGDQLWQTDGTSEGTSQVTNFADSAITRIDDLAMFNNALYFATNDGALWRMSDNAIAISGIAFDDSDADAGRDGSEVALAGVRIYIDANNNRAFDAGEKSTLTDDLGRYAFTGLSAGTYRLRQVVPSGARETSPSYVLPLVNGDHVTKTFGSVRGGGMISGRAFESAPFVGGGLGGFIVWLDSNGNAKRQKSEPATTTDDSGRYAFSGLNAGIYTVRVERQTNWFPSGVSGRRVRVKTNRATTSDFVRIAASSVRLSIFDSATDIRVSDPKLRVSLSRRVDADTITPLANVPIRDNFGRYVFNDLEAGEYIVTVSGNGWKRKPDNGQSISLYDLALTYAGASEEEFEVVKS